MTRHPIPLGAALAALMLLAGCGADGAPLRPAADQTGVSFNGEGRVGVSTP